MLSISAKNSKDQNQCKRHASSDSSRLTESNMCTVLGPKTPVHEYNKSALQYYYQALLVIIYVILEFKLTILIPT